MAANSSYITAISSLPHLKALIGQRDQGLVSINEFVIQNSDTGSNFSIGEESFLKTATAQQFHYGFWDKVVYSTITKNVIFRG